MNSFQDKYTFLERKTTNKVSPSRWLELGIVADYSVVDFHGTRIQHYILALLNIVSVLITQFISDFIVT